MTSALEQKSIGSESFRRGVSFWKEGYARTLQSHPGTLSPPVAVSVGRSNAVMKHGETGSKDAKILSDEFSAMETSLPSLSGQANDEISEALNIRI